MENKFKKGFILGGILAVIAAVGLTKTKEGQNLTDELQNDLKMLVKHLKKNLHKSEDITRESFEDLVSTVVEEYAKTKKLTIEAKDALINNLKSKWTEMEDEYMSEHDKEDK